MAQQEEAAGRLFSIAAEYQDRLEETPVTDSRSDEEILETFRHYEPITSEKNVWAYWDSGIHNAAGFSQRNVCDWVRILGPEWTVRVLDKVPGSPNNALKWIPENMLPEAWIKDTFEGPWVGAHSADCLRGALLYLYGGVYSDVGTIMFMHPDRVFWNQLADPETPYEVGVLGVTGTQIIANGFLASRKGSTFIKLWHQLFVHLWRDGKTSVLGMIKDPLVAFGAKAEIPDTGPRWKWSISGDKFFEYLVQSICWVRLCMLEDAADGFNASDYWKNKVLCSEYTNEALPGEQMLGYDNTGTKMFKLLSLPVNASEEVKATEDYKKAHQLAWEMLSDYSIQKLGHGKNILDDVQLAIFWTNNPGTDRTPGTFAHLIRYGSVHFRQKRESANYIKPPPVSMTIKRGLLEPPPEGEPI